MATFKLYLEDQIGLINEQAIQDRNDLRNPSYGDSQAHYYQASHQARSMNLISLDAHQLNINDSNNIDDVFDQDNNQSLPQTSFIEKTHDLTDIKERLQDKDPNLDYSEEQIEKQQTTNMNHWTFNQNDKNHLDYQDPDLPQRSRSFKAFTNSRQSPNHNNHNPNNSQNISMNSHSNSYFQRAQTQKFGTINPGHGNFSKNNSFQSFGSHFEEFKALEEYTQSLLTLKVKANDLYQQQQYDQAQSLYQSILDTFQTLKARFQNEDFLMTTNILLIYREAHVNKALCLIKQRLYEEAIECLSQILYYDGDGSNIKALYLRGKSYLAIREYELALSDFKLARDIKINNDNSNSTNMNSNQTKEGNQYAMAQHNSGSNNNKTLNSGTEIFDQYIQELEITINNTVKQDDQLLPVTNLPKPTSTIKAGGGGNQPIIVHKEKRGGVMQDGDIQKSIDEILNLKKPRSFFNLLRMIISVTKNFTFSFNAFLLAIIGITLYHYLVKKKLLCLFTFRLLDRIA
eukprot:403333850